MWSQIIPSTVCQKLFSTSCCDFYNYNEGLGDNIQQNWLKNVTNNVKFYATIICF